jgi:hypothetical protein
MIAGCEMKMEKSCPETKEDEKEDEKAVSLKHT